jgi:hypothetical protein
MSRAVSLAVEKRDRCHEPIHLIGFRKNRHTGSLSIYCGAMSAIGPKRASLAAPHISAIGGEADMT